jgi:formate dehydrogenase maturation protein FdhE
MIPAKWDRRIRRANDLASSSPFAAEALTFYEHVAKFQKGLYANIQNALKGTKKTPATRPLRDELDLFLLLPQFSPFLSAIEHAAPKPLAQAASGLASQGPAGWQQAIEHFWFAGLENSLTPPVIEGPSAPGSSAENTAVSLLAWIFLQPYAEFLADHRESEVIDGTPSTCPLCGALPIVGVLRSEGDGAKKSLLCMLCAHEWRFRRVYCPSCGEEREPQMAFYSAPEIAHVRVDVCDTCHTYLKSVDLTKTGLAVPVVDEIATIPLDVWALQHGYRKLQLNILGI